jgi:predicted RNA-binding Zn-ribbon protein involved in translation (DUF1610 family)
MNPEIERLIKLAIADGEITEKERAVIMRKAESLGEDKDEVELILEGELALFKKEYYVDQKNQPKLIDEVILNKCTSCGANLASFITKCPECGNRIIKRESSSSINQLMNEIKAITKEENKLLDSMVFCECPDYLEKITAFAHKKAAVIFYTTVPNSKEEILKFLSKAIPNAEIKTVSQIFDGHDRTLHNIIALTWNKKCQEILIKSRFSMQDDKKSLAKIEAYAKQIRMK